MKSTQPTRKPYTPPRIVYTARLETQAGSPLGGGDLLEGLLNLDGAMPSEE